MSTKTEVSFQYLNAAEVDPIRDEVVEVYREAFAGPPYYRTVEVVIDFTESLPRHATRDAFRMVAARDPMTRQLLGFTYGFTVMPGQWWHDMVSPVMSAEQRAIWLKDAYELAELAVIPERQGRGIGGRLHDLLLASLPHRTAVLSTIRVDTPAFRLYRKRGWVVLLDDIMFPNVVRPYRIMGLELNPAA